MATFLRNGYTFYALLLIICIIPLLQGCDSFTSLDQEEKTLSSERGIIPTSTKYNKLRHPDLLNSAKKQAAGEAGKSGTLDANLFLAFSEYEADGVTPRLLDRFEVTNRILEEYGVTRRVLNQYGITRRVLEQYGVTRRVLNQYGITRRILNQYGITRRILNQYGDQITDELLADFSITEAMLLSSGLGEEDLSDFNKMASLLTTQGITTEEFADALDDFEQTIRLKVSIDGVHLGITVSMDSDILDAFLEEMDDDPDILFAEPDAVFDTTDLGTVVGGKNKSQITPWGITNIAVPLLSKNKEKKAAYQDVDVYILDSGAMKQNGWDDLNFATQKDFTMLFENPEELLWDEDNAPDVSGFDPGGAGNPIDESGHGVHIAGTIGAKNDKIAW